MLRVDRSFFSKIKRGRRVDRFKDTTCGSYTYFMKLFAYYRFKILFYFLNGTSDSFYVVYLSVKHRSCVMLSLALCDNVKCLSGTVSHRPHDTSCTYIQTEHKLSGILLSLCHLFTSHQTIL